MAAASAKISNCRSGNKARQKLRLWLHPPCAMCRMWRCRRTTSLLSATTVSGETPGARVRRRRYGRASWRSSMSKRHWRAILQRVSSVRPSTPLVAARTQLIPTPTAFTTSPREIISGPAVRTSIRRCRAMTSAPAGVRQREPTSSTRSRESSTPILPPSVWPFRRPAALCSAGLPKIGPNRRMPCSC